MENAVDPARLRRQAAACGLTLTEPQSERLARYARELAVWNEKMNLTAITDPSEVEVKHFVDSLTVLPLLPEGAFSLVDVGTGAGFPGVPLALVRPDMALTLLDSLNKRLIFLEAACETVGVRAVRVHARAEEAGRRPDLRERFDVATARAVAALPTLCEYALPLVKVGGRLIALKGPEGTAEAAAAATALTQLGGELTEVRRVTLPAVNGQPAGERNLVVITKKSKTPAPYPRPSAKIAKNPLK